MEGDTGHTVFDTAFAINICYGRHHNLNWKVRTARALPVIINNILNRHMDLMVMKLYLI